jgi:hypothetical protein
MKAEINNENKAKFFALYWGQKVFEWKYPEHAVSFGIVKPVSGFIENFAQCGWLNLKPLSQISDEDAIDFLKILWSKSTITDCRIDRVDRDGSVWSRICSVDYDYKNSKGQIYCNIDNNGFSYLNSNQDTVIKLADFLRSRGYALPWMGLTVDELVKAGWVKLTVAGKYSCVKLVET